MKAKVGKKYNPYAGSAAEHKTASAPLGNSEPPPLDCVCVHCSVGQAGSIWGVSISQRNQTQLHFHTVNPIPCRTAMEMATSQTSEDLSHDLSRSMSCSISLFMGFVCLPITIRLPWLSHKTLSLWQKNKPVFIKISGSAFPRHQRDSHM